MLTLMLLRHAKAEPHAAGRDHDRALTEKGEADARALGSYMARIGYLPDRALVSGARRTRQTFDLFVEGAGRAIDGAYDEALYNATDGQLRDLLRGVDPSVATLMMVGHNPGIMELAARLARDGDVTELARLRDRFPPCSLALITFDTDDWREARATGGRLDLLLLPEDVRSGL